MPNSAGYDSMMVSAGYIKGDGAFLSVDYCIISEAEYKLPMGDMNKIKEELAKVKHEYDSEHRLRLRIQNSLSWKMTVPIRAIGRVLGLPNKKRD